MKDYYGKHALEPVWQKHYCVSRGRLPEALRDWLLDHSSLTLRLRHACCGQFNVEVLSQRLERPMLSEARALHRPPVEIALVRQVRLRCGNSPWVFARTIVPLTSLRRGLRRLALLGSRPLGAVLFTDPTMERSAVEVARIRKGQRLYRMAMGASVGEPREIWGRRSVFILQDNPLLVSEFFLPALLAESGCGKCV